MEQNNGESDFFDSILLDSFFILLISIFSKINIFSNNNQLQIIKAKVNQINKAKKRKTKICYIEGYH